MFFFVCLFKKIKYCRNLELLLFHFCIDFFKLRNSFNPRSSGRRVTQVVRDFLYAQRVQPPVELFVDWLAVGHVDEFLSFVPAPDGKVRTVVTCLSPGSGPEDELQGGRAEARELRRVCPLHTGLPDAPGQP